MTVSLSPPLALTLSRRLPALAGEPRYLRDLAELDALDCYTIPEWNVDPNLPPRLWSDWSLDADLNIVEGDVPEVEWRGRPVEASSFDRWQQHVEELHEAWAHEGDGGVTPSLVYELYGDSRETSRGISDFFHEDRFKLVKLGAERIAAEVAARYSGLGGDSGLLARILLRFIGKIVRRARDLDRDDVLGACLEGLVKARNRWTPTGGATFTTYAHVAMQRCVADLRPRTDKHGDPVEVEAVAAGDTRHVVELHEAGVDDEATEDAVESRRGRKAAALPDDLAAKLNEDASREAWHRIGSEDGDGRESRCRRVPPPESLPEDVSRQAGSDHHLDWLDALQAFSCIPDGDLLYERRVLDRPVAEIAARRGIASKTVSNRLTRARMRSWHEWISSNVQRAGTAPERSTSRAESWSPRSCSRPCPQKPATVVSDGRRCCGRAAGQALRLT